MPTAKETALATVTNMVRMAVNAGERVTADQVMALLDRCEEMERAQRINSAAPELLKSLHGLLELHLDAVFVCGKDDEKQVEQRLHACRVAIAKAEAP